MKVAVIGSESTGGRFIARLLGSDPDLNIRHWSLPHGPRPNTYWPIADLAAFDPTVVFVTVRGWEPTLASKVANHQPNRHQAEEEIRLGYEYLFGWLSDHKVLWRFMVYEFLVAFPEVAMRGCWEMLGRPYQEPGEELVDGNEKWLMEVER